MIQEILTTRVHVIFMKRKSTSILLVKLSLIDKSSTRIVGTSSRLSSKHHGHDQYSNPDFHLLSFPLDNLHPKGFHE